MKKVGDKVTLKDREIGVFAEYEVKKVAKLPQPGRYESLRGEEAFNPTIILLEATTDDYPPDKKGGKLLWFPYWITIPRNKGKEKYGQFAPMYGEDCFLPLLKEAIRQGFFTQSFLEELRSELEQALRKGLQPS